MEHLWDRLKITHDLLMETTDIIKNTLDVILERLERLEQRANGEYVSGSLGVQNVVSEREDDEED